MTQEVLKKERRFIFAVVLGWTLFGALMIYESSSIYAFNITSDPAYFFKKQLLFFVIGLGLFFLTLFVDLEFLKRYNKEFLIFTIFLLILAVVLGKKSGGAKRWLCFLGFNIQPSEILKISFMLYCADYFRRKKKSIINIRAGLFPLGLILGLICVLLLGQPDLGTAVFWVIWTILLFFLFKARKKHLIFVILFGIAVSFFLIKFYPYRFRRIIAYINPFLDPQGAGYQLIQSQIAYGAGGLWGLGFGAGQQKLSFLPAAHTDFIFSIIAEEFGLWGSLGFISLFFLIFHKMFKIAESVDDVFKKGILRGIVFIFFLEVVINIGVSCGLFPTKGLPLPFMSYGGSSLVVHYILLGLFFNASRIDKILTKDER
ncbi:MAG: putative lipid II flippase FtsW [Candidatus Omnitrophota bacterium]